MYVIEHSRDYRAIWSILRIDVENLKLDSVPINTIFSVARYPYCSSKPTRILKISLWPKNL